MKHSPVANIEFIKQVNTASVYRLIDEKKQISRVALAKLSELAPASITKMTRQLMAAGLIKEVAQQASTGGRPAISLTCEIEKFIFVSCKLGRNNLTIALHDIAGTKLTTYRVALDTAPDNDVIPFLLAQIADFIDANINTDLQRLIAIAVTSPGLIDRESGTIVYLPKHNLKDIPLGSLLTKEFSVPAYIANHTQSLSLAELYFGAAQDCQDSVLLSVHDGVGSGIINNGKIFTNYNNQVGEIGHIRIDPLGLPCHCGSHGCLETIASNEAILKQITGLINQGHETSLTIEGLTIEGICNAANSGDELAVQVLQRVSKLLGQAIAIIVNLFNPQKLLIKGEIVAAKELIFPIIEHSVQQHALGSFVPNVVINEAQFQNEPSMAGVALVRKALLEGSLLNHIIHEYDND
ncbi:ROK family protein [Moritella viscosa]|uniref:N-acetylglucosamine repressor n=1 Tax=Moritella viscosa TaxID=80854 RepID=A0A090IGS6_9GAMM|nr:ROK family protein [Moritella viscosa]CED59084.1 N-acetylglucosamine repressor [Moritella viscosa]SGZ04126.1 N-acetylglucosamine repressor [Moritella viscosa]SGZ07290.1 N-acetylglucosamine repressor [Moritella viscosa]SGZ08363.1 N-acetylglucosamine repressor [Moritella viscosa]SGZ17053.1 N-acetylglucosamine repressor [Moritella viscosa]